MPNTVTVELPPGKLFTCPGLDWHLKHETGLNDNVCREGIKLEEALKPLLNLACEERIVFICITRHMNTIATRIVFDLRGAVPQRCIDKEWLHCMCAYINTTLI